MLSRYLKGRKPSVRVVLADPTGSSLFHRVKHGVCYTVQQAEKTVRKHRYDSIVEGVGLDRLTSNFKLALIDDAERIADQEILDTAHYLLREEGLFVGSSSAMNVAAACRVALSMPKGSHIVTIICDSGQRHLSRFWNPAYISDYNLSWPEKDVIPSFFK
jgi:cysteine synthase